MDFLLRAATPADAGLIADMTRAAWADKVAASSSGHNESDELVARHLQEGGGYILLIGGAPAGSVRWLPLESDPEVLEMLRMGILPAWRGYRLSRHLLEAVLDHALGSCIRELRIAVRTDQPRLLDLYAAYGFELAIDLEYGHANPLEPAPIVMRRMLRS